MRLTPALTYRRRGRKVERKEDNRILLSRRAESRRRSGSTDSGSLWCACRIHPTVIMFRPSHFGVICKRPLAADETFGFIKAILTPAGLSVKADPGWEGPRRFRGLVQVLQRVGGV